MNRSNLNNIYKTLEDKKNELVEPFSSSQKEFQYTIGYFNGHYSKDDNGMYTIDYFPIPVISIKDICDIEIGLDYISISTKLKRAVALQFDYHKLSKYKFEAYGVDEYLDDFYVEGNTFQELIYNIEKSSEKDIGFSFQFQWNFNGEQLLNFTKFLKEEGFFY